MCIVRDIVSVLMVCYVYLENDVRVGNNSVFFFWDWNSEIPGCQLNMSAVAPPQVEIPTWKVRGTPVTPSSPFPGPIADVRGKWNAPLHRIPVVCVPVTSW